MSGSSDECASDEELSQFPDPASATSESIALFLQKMYKTIISTNKEIKAVAKQSAQNEENSKIISQEVTALRNTITTLESELASIRGATRELNLFIYNIPDNAENNANLRATVLNFLRKLHSDFRADCLDTIRRVGRAPGERPIFIKFSSRYWKSLLFRHISKLKDEDVSVSNDLTPEERDDKKRLLALRPGLTKAGIVFKMHDNKMLINNKLMSPDEVQEVFFNDPTDGSSQTSSRSNVNSRQIKEKSQRVISTRAPPTPSRAAEKKDKQPSKPGERKKKKSSVTSNDGSIREFVVRGAQTRFQSASRSSKSPVE